MDVQTNRRLTIALFIARTILAFPISWGAIYASNLAFLYLYTQISGGLAHFAQLVGPELQSTALFVTSAVPFSLIIGLPMHLLLWHANKTNFSHYMTGGLSTGGIYTLTWWMMLYVDSASYHDKLFIYATGFLALVDFTIGGIIVYFIAVRGTTIPCKPSHE